MSSLTVVDHPLLKRDLTILRSRETPHGAFRKTVSDAAAILAYEAMQEVDLKDKTIETPLESTTGYEIADEVIVVPIMRAGLGMVDGFVRFIPEARVGHLGMQRDEETYDPVDYYSNIPDTISEARVFVVDPMLATGGSASFAIEHLKQRGAERIHFACLVAAPEGIERLQSDHSDVPIVTATVDRELDDNAFIRPGLGDAGDRIFGTTG
ncbi:uracil phosphoribosyltransferase [Longibacter salinarum]|uniref:Uracil phosphoribosyltransferase n=1 Tax=Longibacter salinarum TaxID=1850348 RepID=A0A2A8D0U4_9BACT|nr:uracil phosphoribosyltransferase [Longibacter salinarum]PEN14427.1 uracil phosphoribosyltransferase [Longibacter salinarum]